MTIAYRDATPADAATVQAVYVASFDPMFRHLYAPADYDAFMAEHDVASFAGHLGDPDYAVHLAETEGGHAVGFAKLGPTELPYDAAGRTCLDLKQLYLLDAAKGTGVADALLSWVVDEARRRGADELWLSVFSDNPRARRFYAKRGFAEVGGFKFMVGSHADDEILCRRMLA